MNRKILIAVEILFDMAKGLGQAMSDIAFTPYGQLKLRPIPRTTYYDRLEKFERYGLVKKVLTKYGNTYVLTDKVKHLRELPSQKNNRMDGLSTIVMFDIPEEKHKARDNFRRYLLKNGYSQVQKSVFISPFRVFSQMKEFAKELGIESNISIIAGKLEQF